MSETDEIAELLRDYEVAAAAFASIGERLRGLNARAAIEPGTAAELNDFARPMEILRDYDISRAELHRRCVKNTIEVPGGFSHRCPGETDYLISVSRFDRHFRRHPPRKRRSETKKRASETR